MLTLLERITADPANGEIDALVDLVALIRPSGPAQGQLAAASVVANIRTLVQLLKGNPAHAAALRHYLLHVLSIRRHTSVYTDIGILPSYGFFSELFRRLSYRILPPAIDKLYLSDCLDRILSVNTDYQWLQAIDARDWQALFSVIACGATHLPTEESIRTDQAARQLASMELLEAIQTLSHRISAMGLEPDLVRIHPDLEKFESPFLVQNVEVHRFLDGALRLRDEAAGTALPENAPAMAIEDAAHLLVMLDQCDHVIIRIRKNSLHLGTTVALTYLLVRLTQNIDRLRRLLSLVDVSPAAMAQPWTDERRRQTLELALDLAKAHNRKYAIRELFTANIHLLARNVTENASQTGEHYIAENHREYRAMFRSSAGAGFVIGFMAMLKILAGYLRAAPLVEAFLFSLNYSLGFMLIHLLHFTVATKQPAMTAARIATDLHSADNRNIHIDSLADLIVKVLRTQFIAVIGNLATAFPTALAIASAWISIHGHHLVSPDKARHLLQDIDPLGSPALFHAAIAGVCLFLAGMISGYFDNRAVYTKMAQRVLRLQRLQRLIGQQRHERVARYIEKNLGGLMGNLFFGILLGTIGTFGQMTGLPLDIRHITFSATNLAIAWVGLDYLVSWQIMLTSVLGILCIGTINLLVSFGLALFVALRSRQVRFSKGWTLVRALLSRLLHRPLDFFRVPDINIKPE